MDQLMLPRVSMEHFDGSPLNYWKFMTSFKNVVLKHTNDKATHMALLLQYCQGKAKKAIEPFSIVDPEVGFTSRKSLEMRT